jgi:hypothetical protein
MRRPTRFSIRKDAGVAQLVEQLFRKQQVARSIRVAGSILPDTSTVFCLTNPLHRLLHPSYTTPFLRGSLPYSIRPYRHFTVQCSVTFKMRRQIT